VNAVLDDAHDVRMIDATDGTNLAPQQIDAIGIDRPTVFNAALSPPGSRRARYTMPPPPSPSSRSSR